MKYRQAAGTGLVGEGRGYAVETVGKNTELGVNK